MVWMESLVSVEVGDELLVMLVAGSVRGFALVVVWVESLVLVEVGDELLVMLVAGLVRGFALALAAVRAVVESLVSVKVGESGSVREFA